MDFSNFYYKFSLFEGGNVRVRKEKKMGGNVSVKLEIAEKISLDKLSKSQFNQLKLEIVEMMKSLNKKFEIFTGEPLWPNVKTLIDKKVIFSGSTKLFFDKSYDELKKYKKVFGDVDLQIPEKLMPKLKEFFSNNEDETFGNMIYFGNGGHSIIQLNTIFKTQSFPNVITNLQFDFEPTFWKNGEPTEFSNFSHNSSWEDIKSKIKGAFSKLIMRALVSNKEKLGDIAVITPTGKISKADKYDNPGMRKFSVDKGVRVAYIPVVDNKGVQQKTNDGKLMYRDIPTTDSTYERDLVDIFGFIFDVVPTSDEKYLMYSYIGILKLMKKYLEPDMVTLVFNDFMKIIWGTQAQEIEQGEFNDGINWEDFNVKKSAYDQFIKIFPEFGMSDDELKVYVTPFYNKLAKRKMVK